MAETSRLAATFILNAVWQLTAITALALVCTKLCGRAPSRFAHGVWIAALSSSLLIPAATVMLQHRERTARLSETATRAQPNAVAEAGEPPIPVSFHSLSRAVSFSPGILRALLWVYGIVLLFHVARLAWFGYQTWRACQLAYPRPLPPALARIVENCVRSFRHPGVCVLCTELSGPATFGFRRPRLLLPEAFFLDAFPEDDLCSAISHELAHVVRRDFLFNLLYQIASLPVCFHPCAALILSRIAQTRELVCDEIAAQMLPTTRRYARSLLHIAQSMPTGAGANCALGLFDTHSLEERIMNILNHDIILNHDTGKKTRVARWIAVCLIGAASVGLSAFSLRLNNASFRSFAADISGTWKASIEVANGRVDNIFVFQVDGSKILGTVTSGTMSALPISEGKIDGGNISFSVVEHAGGRDFKMRYAGKVKGNEMKLTLTFPTAGSRPVDMIAQRVR